LPRKHENTKPNLHIFRAFVPARAVPLDNLAKTGNYLLL
jgi:hypothetical protein